MSKPIAEDIECLPLDGQIDARRSDIRTDKLDMTFGEFANMYEAGELVVAPAYQRLFRWSPTQKTRFVESILLGIPTPAIFVAETEQGVWELVDGMQRLSTVLEFFGVLRDADGAAVPPSSLQTEESAIIPKLEGVKYQKLSLRSRLSIRRAGCRVEVVKVGSGRRMKYDLFERLNTGGTKLTDQEIRNCIFRAEAPDFMDYFDKLADYESFKRYLGISVGRKKSLYDRGLVLRFFALKNYLDHFRHDVEPFITEYVHKVVDREVKFDRASEESLFKRTVNAITATLGAESWKHWKDDKGKAGGSFSPYVFDALAISVAAHIDDIESLDEAERRNRLNAVKQDDQFKNATGPGGNTKPRLLQRLAAAERVIANVPY